MTRPQVRLPPLGDPVDELWEVLLKLGRTRGLPWMLIGGQMMLLTALEHHREPVQVSQDGDAVADIRAEPQALRTPDTLPGPCCPLTTVPRGTKHYRSCWAQVDRRLADARFETTATLRRRRSEAN